MTLRVCGIRNGSRRSGGGLVKGKRRGKGGMLGVKDKRRRGVSVGAAMTAGSERVFLIVLMGEQYGFRR
jgi:hypothetical protein